MNTHYRDSRKIDPTRGDLLGDNTPNNADRIEIGPTQLAFLGMGTGRAETA